MAKAPKTIDLEIEVQTGPVAVAAIDQAIADLASKLNGVPAHHRAVAADIVEHIERLTVVRNKIESGGHG